MTPADLYRGCRVSAWRLETLQHYAGDEDGRQRAFRAGEPLPPPGPGKRDDLRLIASLRQAGRALQRVHIVDRPLSGYIRYELAAYRENADAGEDIRIADRSAYPDLGRVNGDFAVFDAGTAGASVILFRYSTGGHLLGYKHVTDRGIAGDCERRYALALARSVSLDEFMAAVG